MTDHDFDVAASEATGHNMAIARNATDEDAETQANAGGPDSDTDLTQGMRPLFRKMKKKNAQTDVMEEVKDDNGANVMEEYIPSLFTRRAIQNSLVTIGVEFREWLASEHGIEIDEEQLASLSPEYALCLMYSTPSRSGGSGAVNFKLVQASIDAVIKRLGVKARGTSFGSLANFATSHYNNTEWGFDHPIYNTSFAEWYKEGKIAMPVAPVERKRTEKVIAHTTSEGITSEVTRPADHDAPEARVNGTTITAQKPKKSGAKHRAGAHS